MALSDDSAQSLAHADKLAEQDWRFHAIWEQGGGVGHIVGTQVLTGRLPDGSEQQLPLYFPVPSMPALCLSIAREAHSRARSSAGKLQFADAPNALNALVPTESDVFFDLIEAKIIEVIQALTAIEAFTNETIHEMFRRKAIQAFTVTVREGGRTRQRPLSAHQIERNVSLDVKLETVLPRLIGVLTLRDSPTWPEYVALKSLRNRLIHAKDADRQGGGPAEESVWKDLFQSWDKDFSRLAHAVIGHFIPNSDRRWHREFSAQLGPLPPPTP